MKAFQWSFLFLVVYNPFKNTAKKLKSNGICSKKMNLNQFYIRKKIKRKESPRNRMLSISMVGLFFLSLFYSFSITQKDTKPSLDEFNETLSTGELQSLSIPNKTNYNRNAAIGYANQWYNSRNWRYNDFTSSGGDCANFVSQCLIAGSLSLYKGTNGLGYGVYPDVDRPSIYSNGTIPYCDYLNIHLKTYQNTQVTYVIDTNATIPSSIERGDVVIFGNKSGDKYQHAMIVVWRNASDLGLAGHTSDVWNRSFWTTLNAFSCVTFYKIIEQPASYYHFRVDTSTLNVRVGPGRNQQNNFYQAIGTISQNQEYIAYEYIIDTDGRIWWHFWFDDRSAWCAGWYTVNVTGKLPFEVNASTSLNVRDGPGTNYSIFGQVYPGMRFVSDLKDGVWYRFNYGGQIKYCHSSYVFLLDESPAAPTYNDTKVVMGFLPYWVSENQNWTPLSHVAWFSIDLKPDGTIRTANGWPKTSLVNQIKATNTKVLLTATMFNSTEITMLISSSTYRTTAINTLLTQVQAGNADGVVIDFEHPKSSGDDVRLVTFMQELSIAFKAANQNYHVSICTPSVDWWNTYDYGNLSIWCDSLMIMGYGYYYSGSSTAGPTAPLYGGSYNLNKTVYAHLNKGAPASKIVLGLPFYGYDYPVTDTQKQAPTNGSGSSITYSANEAKKQSINPTLYYDTIYECEWYNYYSAGTWRQVWCDTAYSLGKKMDYINNMSLGGLGIWAWGYQGSSGALETLIAQKIPVDKNSPQITITSPANDSTISQNPVNFTWNASDDVGLAYFEVSLNQSSWLNVGLNTSYSTYLENGSYQFSVRAWDKTNKTANASIVINVTVIPSDIYPPLIWIISPQNSTTHTEGNVSIQWDYEDNIGVVLVESSINGSEWVILNMAKNLTINCTEGLYIIKIRVKDAANNTAIDEVIFNVVNASQNLMPQISILTPSNESMITTNPVFISWSTSVPSGLDHYEISINNQSTWLNLGINTNYYHEFENGTWLITVKVIDSANRTVNTSIVIYAAIPDIDTIPPNLWLLSPLNYTNHSEGVIFIEWDYQDNWGVVLVELSINGGDWINLNLAKNVSLNLTVGEYIISIRTLDSSNNSAQIELRLTVYQSNEQNPPQDPNDQPQQPSQDPNPTSDGQTNPDNENNSPIPDLPILQIAIIGVSALAGLVFIVKIVKHRR